MKARELIRSHRYAEAIADLRRILANNPEDIAAVEGMAKALLANEVLEP
jgi:Flp pilus assembly protein TadD